MRMRRNKHLRFKHALFLGIILAALLAALGALFVISAISQLPPLTMLQEREVSQSTRIYDRTGTKLLYEIYGEEKRTVVPFDQIPLQIKQATLAIEDAGFYEHSALDFSSLLRALLVNIRNASVVQGGSTITQQLAKKAFLSDERTFTRKLKELLIAYKLEQAFTKDQILELYLNQIPYGTNAYGIESAAQTYFQKTAIDLTLPEAALLAAIPQAPSYYSPFGSHVQELLARKNLVLTRMAELGYITKTQLAVAEKTDLVFSRVKNLNLAPHFAIAVKEYLEQQYGEDYVRRAGLKVITTLDATLQESAEKAVAAGAARNTELYKGTNAAMVVADPKTGQILALVGSRNYFDKEIDGQFNVAMQGLRQPGSALKPFVYLAALKLGYPATTILFDTETEFNTVNDPAKSYKPHDYDESFKGPISFRNALAQSVNIPAVKTLYLVGVDNFLKMLQQFGVNTLEQRDRFGLSLVLGGGEVYLNELVGAYSVLAQEGVKHEQHLTLSVTDQKGRILESYRDIAEPVADPQPVRAINDILSDKNARAPLFQNSLNLTVFDGYDVALKTGTTNDYRDAWAIGYSPNLVAGVWAGNNDNVPMERRGGSILAAVPILNAFLREALPTMPAESFNPPEPERVNKPMLNGNHIGYFQADGKLYPQIHDILYYVDKRNPLGPIPVRPENDPQFSNWEQGVLTWAGMTIPGGLFGGGYNQPVPPGATLVDTAQGQVGGGDSSDNATSTPESATIIITSPQSGTFIRGNQIPIEATISCEKEMSKIEIFFNGALIDSRSGNLGLSLHYQSAFSPGAVAQPQNTIRIVATDVSGGSTTREVVVYR